MRAFIIVTLQHFSHLHHANILRNNKADMQKVISTIREQELWSWVGKFGVGIGLHFLQVQHFISFQCTTPCRQPGLSRGYIDFQKIGQTDGQTAVFVELLRN